MIPMDSGHLFFRKMHMDEIGTDGRRVYLQTGSTGWALLTGYFRRCPL